MSELSVQFPEIRNMVAKRHSEYLERFGKTASIIAGEDQLKRTRILAKLDFLCKAFLEAKVIDKIESIMVSSRDGTFPMSISISRKNNPLKLYLLNTGVDVIISDSVGLAQTSDTVESRIMLVTDTKRVCKHFSGVLDQKFDWLHMANFIVDAIHETLYEGHDARSMRVQVMIG